MKKANIIRDGKITHSATMPDQELTAWLLKHDNKGTFGTPAHDIYDVDGNYVDSVDANYTIEIVDIASQLAQQAINEQSAKFLSDTDWQVLRHLRQVALSQVPTLSNIEYLELEQRRSDAAAKIVKV